MIDATSNTTWSGTETTGASAYDTAVVTHGSGSDITPSGAVTFLFFSNSSCSGAGSSAGATSIGTTLKSTSQGPLAVGSYGFQASYSGDANYKASTGTCEPFSVGTGTAKVATTVIDTTSNAAWAGTETPFASAYATATVTGAVGVTPSGTLSFLFFGNGSCSGAGTTAGALSLSSSLKSSTEGSLASGSYSFKASYGGDANYSASTGPCEGFAVQTANEITPTSTTCAQFKAGIPPLSTINYSTKGTTISQTNEGVFFYSIKLTLGTGSQTIAINQTTTYAPTSGTPFFALASGSSAYDANCTTLNTKIATATAHGAATTNVTFTAGTPGTYYLGIKYSTGSIVGSGPAATAAGAAYTYTFASSGSISKLTLRHK